MTTEKKRLAKLAQKKVEARKAQNQVKLTISQAIARKEWQERWEELRKYAGKVAWSYCAKRLKQATLDQIKDIRDEALSEGWRRVASGEETSAERAIVKSVNQITDTAQRLARQSRPLPELANHSPEYEESRERIVELVAMLPENVRQTAICLSAGMNQSQTSELIGLSTRQVKSHTKTIRKVIGSRFGWLLYNAFEIPVKHRVS